jgi:hypothetical protein
MSLMSLHTNLRLTKAPKMTMPETESFISTKSSPLLVNIGLKFSKAVFTMVNVKRKVHEDVFARPSNLIRNELFEQCKEENVRTGDIISVRHALYRERRKRFPKLNYFELQLFLTCTCSSG